MVSWGPIDFLCFVPSDAHLNTFINSEKGKVGVEDSYCIPQSLKGDGDVTFTEGNSGRVAKKGQTFSESWWQAPAARNTPMSDARAARTSVRLPFH